jgi:hypothetical protein
MRISPGLPPALARSASAAEIAGFDTPVAPVAPGSKLSVRRKTETRAGSRRRDEARKAYAVEDDWAQRRLAALNERNL